MKHGRPLVLGLISGLSVLLLYSWVGTTLGLLWTLNIVNQRWLSGQLQLKGVSGCLLGPVKVTLLHYQDENYEIILNNLFLNLKRAALLKGIVHIKALHLKRCHVISKSQDSSNVTLDQFWNTKKRYFLECARINVGEFKTNTTTITIQGMLGVKNQVNWTLKYCEQETAKKPLLHWEGSFNGIWGDRTQLFLKLRALIPYVLKTNAQENQSLQAHPYFILPIFQGDCQYDGTQFDMRVFMTSNRGIVNKLHAFGRLPYTQIKKTINLNQKIQGGFEIQLKDWGLLKTMQIPVENFSLSEASGELNINSQFQTTFQSLNQGLEKWLTDTTSRLRLAVHWNHPVLPDLGSQFKTILLQGKLHQRNITWKGLLVTPLKKQNASQLVRWKLKGNTDLRGIIDKKLQENKKERLDFRTRLLLTGEAIPLFTQTRYNLQLAPHLNIYHSTDSGILLEGTLKIPKAQLDYVYEDPLFFLDKDVRFTHDIFKKKAITNFDLKTNVKLILGEEVYFRYTGLTGRFLGVLKLIQENQNQPLRAHGELKLLDGKYYYSGQYFKITPHSRLIFNEWIYNPTLDIKAVKNIRIKSTNRAPSNVVSNRSLRVSEASRLYNTKLTTALPMKVEVGARIGGSIENSTMKLFSNPSYHITDPEDTLAYILTGQSAKNVHAASLFLNTAMQLGQGYISYYKILENLRENVGMTLELIAEESMDSTQLVLNQQFTDRWSASCYVNLIKPNYSLKTYYQYKPEWLIGVSFNPIQKFNIELMHQKEYG